MLKTHMLFNCMSCFSAKIGSLLFHKKSFTVFKFWFHASQLLGIDVKTVRAMNNNQMKNSAILIQL